MTRRTQKSQECPTVQTTTFALKNGDENKVAENGTTTEN